MKLLVISAAFPPMASGEAANTFHLCRQLKDRGLDVELLTTQRENIERLDGVNIHPIMNRWSWRELPKLARFLHICAPDAILLMYLGGIYNYHPMITFAPTVSKKILPGVKFVTRFENPLSESSPAYLSLVKRVFRKGMVYWAGQDGCHYNSGTLLRDSDRVIVLCEYHLKLLQDRTKNIEQKTLIIPPAANIQVIPDPHGELRNIGRKRINTDESHFVIGYMGYIYPNKGIDVLLESVAILAKRKKNVRLLIMGGTIDVPGFERNGIPYFDQMKSLSEKLGIKDDVCWAGAFNVVGPDIAAYIHAADVFVLPFDNGLHLNNSSFTSLAAYGVPVIATRRDHTDDILVTSGNVWLCPPRDPIALANAVEKVIDDPGILVKMRSGVHAMANELFSWGIMIERTLVTLV